MLTRVLVILMLSSYICHGQYDIQDYIESTEISGERNLSDLIEEYNHYLKSPIPLNKATEEQLLDVSFLNQNQVKEIIEYREKNKGYVAIEELKLLTTITNEDYQLLSQIFRLEPINTIKRKRFRMDQICRIGSILTPVKGQFSTHERPSFFLRNKQFFNDNLTIGFTFQKDAGEQWIGKNTVTDFTSLSIQYKLEHSPIKQINIGDYNLNIGEGLCFWNGFALGKALQYGNAKNGKRISSYHGADEFNFMRGVAIQAQHKKLYFTPFFSHKKLDASISNGKITSIRTSGQHLSENEILYQNTLSESIIGTAIGYQSTDLNIGFYSSYWKYSLPFEYKDPSQYKLSKSKNQSKSGVHWKYQIKKSEWFGEFSIDEKFSTAIITGLRTKISQNVHWTSSIRRYDNGYKSLYANSFGEKNYTSNEQGFYNCIKWQASSTIFLNLYYDVYEFPQFSYQIESRTIGKDAFIELGKYFTSSKILVRLKHETRVDETEQKLTRIRFQYEKKLEGFTINYRLENAINGKETGWLVYQDIKSRVQGINALLRLAYFNTPSFKTAIYAYQPNVLYAFQTRAYYNTGGQILLSISKRFSNHLKLWLQLAHLTYFNKASVGSGGFETLTPNQSSVNLQFQYLL